MLEMGNVLSTSTIIAIAVGGGSGICIIGCAMALLLLRKRRPRSLGSEAGRQAHRLSGGGLLSTDGISPEEMSRTEKSRMKYCFQSPWSTQRKRSPFKKRRSYLDRSRVLRKPNNSLLLASLAEPVAATWIPPRPKRPSAGRNVLLENAKCPPLTPIAESHTTGDTANLAFEMEVVSSAENKQSSRNATMLRLLSIDDLVDMAPPPLFQQRSISASAITTQSKDSAQDSLKFKNKLHHPVGGSALKRSISLQDQSPGKPPIAPMPLLPVHVGRSYASNVFRPAKIYGPCRDSVATRTTVSSSILNIGASSASTVSNDRLSPSFISTEPTLHSYPGALDRVSHAYSGTSSELGHDWQRMRPDYESVTASSLKMVRPLLEKQRSVQAEIDQICPRPQSIEEQLPRNKSNMTEALSMSLLTQNPSENPTPLKDVPWTSKPGLLGSPGFWASLEDKIKAENTTNHVLESWRNMSHRGEDAGFCRVLRESSSNKSPMVDKIVERHSSFVSNESFEWDTQPRDHEGKGSRPRSRVEGYKSQSHQRKSATLSNSPSKSSHVIHKGKDNNGLRISFPGLEGPTNRKPNSTEILHPPSRLTLDPELNLSTPQRDAASRKAQPSSSCPFEKAPPRGPASETEVFTPTMKPASWPQLATTISIL